MGSPPRLRKHVLPVPAVRQVDEEERCAVLAKIPPMSTWDLETLSSLGQGSSNLTVAQFRGQPAVALARSAEEAPNGFTLFLDLDELGLLRRLLEQAADIAGDCARLRVIGVLAPRPSQVQVAVVPGAVLFRVDFGTKGGVGVRLSPEEARAVAADLQVDGAFPDPMVAEVLDVAGGALRLRGRDGAAISCSILEGLSSARGPYGEHLRLEDLEPGTRVSLLTAAQADTTLLLRADVQLERPRPQGKQEPTDPHREIRRIGEEADAAVARGELETARRRISELRDHNRSCECAFTLAKTVLTMLTCDIAAGNFDAAYPLWLGRTGDKLLDLGNKHLEEGQTSVFDLRLGHQIAAWFHARDPDSEMAVKAVDALMTGVCADAAAHDRFLHALALRNWALLLSNIFYGQVPPEATVRWLAACESYGRTLEPRLFCLPRPSPWILDGGEAVSAPAPSPPGGNGESKSPDTKSMWQRLL